MRRFLLLLVACGTTPATPEAPDSPERARRALVIGIDGLRPDALEAADTPVLDAWRAAGASTLTASTQTGSVTLSGPGWASILTGMQPEGHGVYTNDDLDDTMPSMLTRAREAGLQTAAVVHWAGIPPLLGADAADRLEGGDDRAVGRTLAQLVADPTYDLIFAHLDDVDGAGHGHGFAIDVPEYLDTIATTDSHLAATRDALEASNADWLVLVVTDHGGLGTDHGTPSDDTRTIPMILVGNGETGELPAGTTHVDTTPTALDWLGVPIDGLDGRSLLTDR